MTTIAVEHRHAAATTTPMEHRHAAATTTPMAEAATRGCAMAAAAAAVAITLLWQRVAVVAAAVGLLL